MREVQLTPEELGAPPGTVSNYINPPDQMTGVIILHTTCLTIVTLSLTLRLYTRKFIVRKLAIDDYLCILAWCLSVVYSGLNLRAVANGMSRHQWDFDRLNSASSFQPFTLGIWIYLIYAAIVKLACLFFYRTIFVTSGKTNFFVNLGIVGVSILYIAMFLLQVNQCTPVARVWDWQVPGTCRKSGFGAYSSSAVNAFTDIYVLIVPIPAVLALPLRACRKFRVISVFSLGLSACSISIVRIFMITSIYKTKDFTWTITKVTTWSVIEINTGLLCACLLVLPAFLKRHWPQNYTTGTCKAGNPHAEDIFITVSTETKSRMETEEWSQRNRSDGGSLTTNSTGLDSFVQDVEPTRDEAEPTRFNTSRPLSPVHLRSEPYTASNESETWQERREMPMRGPMGGLPS
ncbi:hypothetical protein GLAREA_11918 [Glarea lozoyensis ATCC 20868]|uniref:Rhodopsin domain-containing protein n=1 Tax=Glarea lozoyensis (strain ATCC 20868 / MF5171) TaxID=1116229 RepID=S3DIJ7_GLAL2|nr:uncharacterized protein GLAREA_11918 [Glarea lozoyensis ATCC 20868]EPE31836.1 hypothetical protein GLAREA_11918 [Glarea lozoyensis ATCC 20868]